MKKFLQTASVGLIASSFAFAANAMEIVFDEPVGPDTIAPSISFGDLTVTAGYSSSNLCCGTDFEFADINAADVWHDASPANGGLGVGSGLDEDTDNFEGSLGGNPNADEVLFFDFGRDINLREVTLNAGDDPGHQDKFDAEATDVFDIFLSNDGQTYTSIFGANTAPTDGELLTLPGLGVEGQYFAVAHVGPTADNGSVGGYIEKVEYANVPEPGTLTLFGLGIAGLGLSRRRR